MGTLPISDGELEVMKVLWERSPQTLPEVIANVRKNRDWGGGTIKTMLTRLYRKKLLRLEGVRRQYRYWPLVSREAYLESASDDFLAQTFEGAPTALLSFLVQKGKITERDLEALQAQLRDMKHD